MPYGLKLVLYLIGAGSLGFILAAMLEPFTWGVNLLFSIAVAYVVIIVGLRLFRRMLRISLHARAAARHVPVTSRA